MSELLRSLSTRMRGCNNPEVRFVSRYAGENNEPGLPMREPQRGRAEIVESGGGIEARDVGGQCAGKLVYFLDGIQRVHTPLTYMHIPVVYGYVAAAIRLRGDDRRMRNLAHEHAENIYFPLAVAPLEALGLEAGEVIDTSSEFTPENDSLGIFATHAHKKVSNQREKLETKLTSRWLRDFDGADSWLLVDGSLAGDYGHYDSPNIVGVIKSHQTQYFPLEQQRKIVDMEPGCRSGAFIPAGRNRPPVYSWYVRLRSNEGHDPLFGLVRVEAPACPRTLDMADEISQWLLAERSPLSMPDARWDKLIYPIHECEMYLKSLAPTRTVLEASRFHSTARRVGTKQ